jgi:hypothetical protein
MTELNQDQMDALMHFAKGILKRGEIKDGQGCLVPTWFGGDAKSDVLHEAFEATHFDRQWVDSNFDRVVVNLWSSDAFGAAFDGRIVYTVEFSREELIAANNGDKMAEHLEELELHPVNEAGSHRTGHLTATFAQIREKVGFDPNIQDDESKVEASWTFADQHGRQASLWCYKMPKDVCRSWSAYGNMDLLRELFGEDAVG